jgi:[ribosomal protein S5]-alanine N-acetyltransferase
MQLLTNILYLKPLDLKELDIFIRALQSNVSICFAKLPNRYRNKLFIDCLEKDLKINVSSKPEEYLFYTIWLIIDKDTESVVGHIFFNGSPDYHGEIELNFEIFEEEKEHLFIKESIEALVVWASTNKRIKNIKTTVPLNKKLVSSIMTENGFEKNTRFQHFESWIWKNVQCQ